MHGLALSSFVHFVLWLLWENHANTDNSQLCMLSLQFSRTYLFLQHAGDLPARDYGTPCDPFVRVSLRRDRRSLRKRTKQVLAEFNSEVVKKEANPNFNGEAFRAHINPADYKVRMRKGRVQLADVLHGRTRT